VGVLRIRDGLVLPDRYAEGLDPACDQFSQVESGRRECAGEGGRLIPSGQRAGVESRRLSGCGDRGYDEGPDGELYRSGGVLCRGGSVSEAEREREAGGFADSAGEGGRRVKRL